MNKHGFIITVSLQYRSSVIGTMFTLFMVIIHIITDNLVIYKLLSFCKVSGNAAAAAAVRELTKSIRYEVPVCGAPLSIYKTNSLEFWLQYLKQKRRLEEFCVSHRFWSRKVAVLPGEREVLQYSNSDVGA